MKKLFLLTFAFALLCTWTVMAADAPVTVSKVQPAAKQDKASSLTGQKGNDAVTKVKKEAAVSNQKGSSEFKSLKDEPVQEKPPYTGPENKPDGNVILQGGDVCGSATVIPGLPYANNGTTASYVNDYDEACPYTGSTSPDVVYSYTPAADVDVTISLCVGPTDYDTKLYVYENVCQAPSDPAPPYACNDDACTAPGYPVGPYNSRIDCVPMTAGNTYYIVVDGYGGEFGTYYINLDECAAPPTLPCYEVVNELWDNGDTDGANGLSMLTAPYRSVLDDFVVPTGGWTISSFHNTLVWSAGGGPKATDYDLVLWSDAGGSPGAPILTFTTALVSEIATGRTWFGRPEFVLNVAVAPTFVAAGTYWLEMHVAGPENAFSMAHATDGIGPEIIGQPVWVYYEDFPPAPQPGINVFGTDYGLNFCLDADIVEPPTGACCDDVTGICIDNVSQLDCPSGNRFVANTLCADLVPLCGEQPACADFSVAAPGTWTGTTCGAGNDCALRTSEEHIYEVSIPNAGLWAFDLCNNQNYDTYLFVGTTCCGAELGSNDDWCGNGLQSYLEFPIAAGTYYVAVEGFSGCGSYELNIYEVVAPTGACCVGGECVATNTQLECDALGGLWFQGQTCPDFQCPVLGCISQPPSAENGYFADYDYPQWMADNFMLGSATDIYGFSFYGGYFSSDTPMDVDDFTLYIRSDAGGVPGASVFELHNIPATTRAQTGVILFGVHEWVYQICFGAFNLGPGTYWVEINNATFGNPDVWFWETGTLDPINGIEGSAWNTASDAGPWNTQPGNLAFTLLCAPCEEVFGACCDDATGNCADNVSIFDCPTGYRFVPNTLCADLFPPCGPPPGACCVNFECVGTMTEADCAALGGSWAIYETCPEYDCQASLLCIDRPNVVYGNGDTDESNGLSMLADPYRSVLDDITVTEPLTIADFHSTLLWTSGGGPMATGYDLVLWDDAGGAPGAPIMALATTLTGEAQTGRTFFGRDEYMMSVTFDEVTLDPGTYWLEMHVVGPENAFVMAMTNDGIGDEIIGQPCWVYYTDFPPAPQPGINVFGADYGINFCLTEAGGPPPGCGPYVVGDFNGSGVFNIADIVNAFSKLKTGSPEPALLCECPAGGGNFWAVAMDVNASCVFNIADVVTGFSYLKTGAPLPVPCPDCPPGAPRRGGDKPLVIPHLDSKAKINNSSGSE